MRVAMLVGFLVFQLAAGLYETGWVVEGVASPDSDGGMVQAFDGDNPPPPPSWP
jgi:hypothetical protein